MSNHSFKVHLQMYKHMQSIDGLYMQSRPATQIKTHGLYGRAAWSHTNDNLMIHLLSIWTFSMIVCFCWVFFNYSKRSNQERNALLLLHTTVVLVIMQPYTSTRCCNRPDWEWTKTTEKSRAYQARCNPQGAGLWSLPIDQIHKLGEDFTRSLGNMTRIIAQGWGGMRGKAGRGRRGQW